MLHLDHSFTVANTDSKHRDKIKPFQPLDIPGRDQRKAKKGDGRFGGMVKALLAQQKQQG